MINEIVLIITLAYSPSGASGTSMEVVEYIQLDMKTCLIEQNRINEFPDHRFDYHAMCVSRASTK